MTLTLEDIEALEKHCQNNGAVTVGAQNMLDYCTLAKRGLLTMPRPIKDAPKDGTRVLVYSTGTGTWPSIMSWRDDQFVFHNSPINLGNPITFIPLSALETP